MHATKSDFYKTKIKGEEFLVEKNYKCFLTPSKLWKKKQSKQKPKLCGFLSGR